MADPRYLTYRMMTLRYEYDGTQLWYRTDSYWDSTSLIASSTWGVGLTLSSHFYSTLDNSGTTNVGKQYVFAFSDGSGIQLSHLTYSDVPSALYQTAGTGANTLVTAPTQFFNTFPNNFEQNYCSGANLLLAAYTTDTSTLATAVAAFSDGYQATLTISMDMLLTGAVGRWRGICMVSYASQYIQNTQNGAICAAYMTGTNTFDGPTDLGGVYLMHISRDTWLPPAPSA